MKMESILKDETRYPSLATFLRAGGILKVGLNTDMGYFAGIMMGKEGRAVAKMDYRDFQEILSAMDEQAKLFFAQNPTK